MKKLVLPLVAAATLACSVAQAGINGYVLAGSSARNTETKGYAGLKWSLSTGTTPAVVLGIVRAKVKSNGDTDGANLAFSLNLAGGIKPGKLKLSYLNGKEDVQGELGLGYDFLKSAPLLGLGVNIPYLNAGVDIYRDGYDPFVTLQTLKKWDKPAGTTCVPSGSPDYSDPNCTTPYID
ncbi:MAG TPA: hypothetical protein VFY35_16540 [Burkholderiaceae bacterium]|nr:hypothetical protein [Burkholderiaceae bacterium]